MLPHNHFLIAGVAASAVAAAFYPQKPISEIGEFVLASGIISSIIDLDIYCLVLIKSNSNEQLKPFRNPIEMYKKFSLFMDKIFETNIIKIGMVTHPASFIFIILIGYLFLPKYFIPAVIGVSSHIISDIPNLLRLKHKPQK